MDGEVAELQTRIGDLKKEGVTNNQLILEQKRDLLRLRVTVESLSNEIVQYQEATNVLEKKLSEAYDGIKKQNDAIAQLAAQRDEFIGKYTNSIKDRNDLVEKYNALVDRMKKMQDATAAGPK
jgi:chromosome segregation ATPase